MDFDLVYGGGNACEREDLCYAGGGEVRETDGFCEA